MSSWTKLETFFCLLLTFCCVHGFNNIECPDPEPSPNTYRLTNESSFQSGGEITYTCFMNHIQTGGSKSLICKGGIFSNTPLQCKLNCGYPKTINGAKFESNTLLYLPGDTVIYTCLSNNATMKATCDVSLGGWRYGDFFCLENLIWDLKPTLTSDDDLNTVYKSGKYRSWTRYQNRWSNSTVYEVAFILNVQYFNPAVLKITIVNKTDGNGILCATVNGPFRDLIEYRVKCKEAIQGYGVNITAAFDRRTYDVLVIAEVDILGINNTEKFDCGSPPILYGAKSSTSTLHPGDVAHYFCLYDFYFINKYNGPSTSTCSSNNTWSQLDNFCGKDEPDPRQIYTDGVECLLNSAGKDYIGKVNYTISGRPCLKWFGHPDVEEWSFPDNVVDGDNYCRNPDGNVKDKPWCFVGDYSTAEYCPLVECNMICSTYEDSFEYIGGISLNIEGDNCLNWQSDSVAEHFSLFIPEAFPDRKRDHAYCRNPARSQKTAWCFTQRNGKLRHSPCYIPFCQTTVPEVITLEEMRDFRYKCMFIYYWTSTLSNATFHECSKLKNELEQDYICQKYLSIHVFLASIIQSGGSGDFPSVVSWYRVACDTYETTPFDKTSESTTGTPTNQTYETITLSRDLETNGTTPSEVSTNPNYFNTSATTNDTNFNTGATTDSNQQTTPTSTSKQQMFSKNETNFITTSNETTNETTLTITSYEPNNETTFTTTTNEPTDEATLTTTSNEPTNKTTLTTTNNEPNNETILTTTSIESNNGTTMTTTSNEPKYESTTAINGLNSSSNGTSSGMGPTSRKPGDSFNSTTISETTPRTDVTSLTTEDGTYLNQSSMRPTTIQSESTHFCSCSCQKDKTVTIVEKEIEKVQKELTVEKSTLSVTIRKQTSAPDNRPSAVSIGYLGIILLAVTLVLIIMPDVLGLVRYLTNYLKNRELI